MTRSAPAVSAVAFVVSLTLGMAAGTASFGDTSFRAMLTGDQEPGGVTTDAFGTATLSLNDEETRLEMSIQIFNLDLDGNQTVDTLDNVRGLHIHAAPAGVNGGVVFGMISPNHDTNGDLVIDPVAGTVTSAWDLSEGNNTTLADQLTALRGQGLYLNVHTEAHTGGEIRGQIIPEPSTLAVLGVLAAVVGCRRRSGNSGK